MPRFAAAILAATALAAPLAAQEIKGSGIVPATVQNSEGRAIGFAAQPAGDSAFVVAMASAAVPAGVFDAATAAAVSGAIASAKFEGKTGSTLSLRGVGPWARILLVGTGTEGSAAQRMREAGGKAAQELKDEARAISIAGAATPGDAGELAFGYALGQYRFDRYKTVGKTPAPAQPVTIVTTNPGAAQALWAERGQALSEGVRLSRNLATEPANVIYPESFVERVRAAFGSTANVRIEVLDEAAMRRLNMGSIVGVGQGSPRGSRLMIVEYNGGSGAPIAFVGKGITFDSGGISLKPGAGMWAMKADMSGAASVMGGVLALARSRAPVNVVGVAALAENMPGDNAQRPGDVVRTMSGKTIEVINTDAEGRLVLADANEYVIDRYKPAALVNIATLTGSIVAALSDEYAGIFSRDDRLAATLLGAGETSGEHLWRMPLHKNYAEDMKSEIADIKNSVEGGGPGAGLGAHFIGFFVDEKTPWAHLDIAGVNYADKPGPLHPKGATGFGVRLFDQFARDWTARR